MTWRLMRRVCSPKVQVKAAGGVRDLDGLMRVRELGASRWRCVGDGGRLLDECRRGECRGGRAAHRQRDWATAATEFFHRSRGTLVGSAEGPVLFWGPRRRRPWPSRDV